MKSHTLIDPWFIENLVCPQTGDSLQFDDGYLVSSSNTRYPVVEGVPIMLVSDERQTIDLAYASIELGKKYAGKPVSDGSELYLESLGVDPHERELVKEMVIQGKKAIDPIASVLVGATNGIAYKHLIGSLSEYPIPEIRLPMGNGRTLLDIGCSWGRWSNAAARKGWNSVGIDPSLSAVMAARRVARQLGSDCRFLVGDARYLPFKPDVFDGVFSYSVLQHFAKSDVRLVLERIRQVLKPGGECLLQMPNALGIRCLQHQLRRGGREPAAFEVRYWTPPELTGTFRKLIGPSRLSVDCFFGLGLQDCDAKFMSPALRIVVRLSSTLRAVSRMFFPLRWVADSVYVHSQSVKE